MGYVRYAGRVGASAVTLGLGVAIANSPAIALANPSGSSSTGSSAHRACGSRPRCSTVHRPERRTHHHGHCARRDVVGRRGHRTGL